MKIFLSLNPLELKKFKHYFQKMQAIGRSESKRLNWIAFIFGNAPLHCLGYFLDLLNMATLQTTSVTMQTSLRNVIRARNEMLPVGKRMANLDGDFTVCKVYKKLLQREGRYLQDIIATGGFVYGEITTVNGEITTANGEITTVMRLDLVTKRYTTLAPMITERYHHATAVLDGMLFVFGGYNNGFTSLSSVECLDLETGQRSDMAPMITPRARLGAAVLGGKIYVAGGEPVNRMGTLVESFDLDTNQWTAEAPMNTPRAIHGLVSVQGKLFAIGGYNQYGYLSSVECFNPSTRVWSNIAALSTARDGLAVAVLGDKLYAIGGVGHNNRILSSVECLDLSVPNSEWTTVAPMTSPRYDMGAVVTGGKIYIAGVVSYGSRSIECFDPNNGPVGRWSVMSETSEFYPKAKIS